MDLEDLFGEGRNKKKWHQPYDRHPRRYNDNDQNDYYDDEYPLLKGNRYKTNGDYHGRHDKIQNIISKLKSHPHKKALITGVLILGFIILIICIALIWAMFPLIMKAVYYLEKNGIQGIADFITQILTKLWEGKG
jgi:hypothetical protein